MKIEINKTELESVKELVREIVREEVKKAIEEAQVFVWLKPADNTYTQPQPIVIPTPFPINPMPNITPWYPSPTWYSSTSGSGFNTNTINMRNDDDPGLNGCIARC